MSAFQLLSGGISASDFYFLLCLCPLALKFQHFRMSAFQLFFWVLWSFGLLVFLVVHGQWSLNPLIGAFKCVLVRLGAIGTYFDLTQPSQVGFLLSTFYFVLGDVSVSAFVWARFPAFYALIHRLQASSALLSARAVDFRPRQKLYQRGLRKFPRRFLARGKQANNA